MAKHMLLQISPKQTSVKSGNIIIRALNTAQQILRKPPGSGFFVTFQIGLISVKDKYH